MADLAGVGPTWYTWLEPQGRDIPRSRPRGPTGHRSGSAIGTGRTCTPLSFLWLVTRRLQQTQLRRFRSLPVFSECLDSWDPYPALITGRRRDVLTPRPVGRSDQRLYAAPYGEAQHPAVVFPSPSHRRLMLDWDREAALTVAAFRAEAGGELVRSQDDQQLITELLDLSPDFAAIWARQDVRERQGGFEASSPSETRPSRHRVHVSGGHRKPVVANLPTTPLPMVGARLSCARPPRRVRQSREAEVDAQLTIAACCSCPITPIIGPALLVRPNRGLSGITADGSGGSPVVSDAELLVRR